MRKDLMNPTLKMIDRLTVQNRLRFAHYKTGAITLKNNVVFIVYNSKLEVSQLRSRQRKDSSEWTTSDVL